MMIGVIIESLLFLPPCAFFNCTRVCIDLNSFEYLKQNFLYFQTLMHFFCISIGWQIDIHSELLLICRYFRIV